MVDIIGGENSLHNENNIGSEFVFGKSETTSIEYARGSGVDLQQTGSVNQPLLGIDPSNNFTVAEINDCTSEYNNSVLNNTALNTVALAK